MKDDHPLKILGYLIVSPYAMLLYIFLIALL